MTLHPDGRPPLPRFTLPSRIFTSVSSRQPPQGRFDNTRAMLRHPGFWALIFVLTILMVAGALMLSDHLHSTVEKTVRDTGRVYAALSR